jgi:hypothetical protein
LRARAVMKRARRSRTALAALEILYVDGTVETVS